MDPSRVYNNPKLEARRQQEVRRQQAVAVMRAGKQRLVQAQTKLERKLRKRAGDATPRGRLAAVVAQQSDLLDAAHAPAGYVGALTALADYAALWLRPADDWKNRTHNVRRQFSQLVRHLFAKYPVPAWLDAVWFDQSKTRQAWFIHVGAGGNLRKATGLPVTLTKQMAHHALLAPDGLSVDQALRYGQARGVGMEQRPAVALAQSTQGRTFQAPEREAFWLQVMQWFARHPMIDPNQVGPVMDFLDNQRFVAGLPELRDGVLIVPPPPQPNLSMTQRDPETLLAQVRAWHEGLHRRKAERDYVWPSCGIGRFVREEGTGDNRRFFVMEELLNSPALRAEGRAMKHCVSTYAASCVARRCAIFSLAVHEASGVERLLTIELALPRRQVVQARGRFNAAAGPVAQRVLRAWAAQAGVTFGTTTFTRAW